MIGQKTMTEWKIPVDVEKLLQEFSALSGGYPPIMSIESKLEVLASSSLHEPTLYPQIVIRKDGDTEDWGSMARSIKHLMRSMSGIPELCTHSDDLGQMIAREINTELEWLACAKTNVAPMPTPIADIVEQMGRYLNNVKEETLPGHVTFRAFQLLRMKLEGDPQAMNALDVLRVKFPQNVVDAECAFGRIEDLELGTPSGKSAAAKILLDSFGIDSKSYFFRTYRFSRGVTDSKSFEYFRVLERVEHQFKKLHLGPSVWLRAELPFAIPIHDGYFVMQGAAILLRRRPVHNSRASWTPSGGMVIEEQMGASGLYETSIVEIRMGGVHDISADSPPGDLLYKNYFTYPPAVRKATSFLNKLISWLKVETKRCDIPDLIPGHLNNLSLKQLGNDGRVVRDIPYLSLELVRMTAGPKNTADEIAEAPTKIIEVPFWRDLIESAKLHLLQGNARRSVLDFCGGFEAFTDAYLASASSKLESRKDSFLRIYDAKLSQAAREEISRLDEKKCGDKKLPISIRRVVKEYVKSGKQPAFPNDAIQIVMKPFDYRNDAAHGREISATSLIDISNAISYLDEFAKNCKR